jgi:hypothetical protein
MNLTLINFNLLNENLTYRMREPFKRKGIRWLELNGGIRWVSLNEGGKAVNERGKKEDKGREKTREKGLLFWGDFWDFWVLGEEHHFHGRGLYCWFWWTVSGEHLLLGVLGSGAGILTESWS